MLILTRRVGEVITIGDYIDVTVLGVKGNQVRLGINAPEEVEVHRQEIYNLIQKEKSEGKPRPQKKKDISKENDNIQTSHTDFMEI